MTTPPALNTVLYGPPGTGKTHQTVDKALEILDPDFLGKHAENRKLLKSRFDELTAAGHVRFVTFHQSFSYEDFVEGLRATTDDSGTMRYEVVDGIFKSLCVAASTRVAMPTQAAHAPPGLIMGSGRTISLQTGQLLGKTYQIGDVTPEIIEVRRQEGTPVLVPIRLINDLLELIQKGDISLQDIKARQVYEKVPNFVADKFFVNGYPNILHLLAECLANAPVPTVTDSALGSAKVLIIDEINRGNVSRIFGELITLIESGKRAGSDEALSVVLPYSKRPFSVPDNVYLIGTMNTADRSLTGIDIALRRRFSFVFTPPRPELLDAILIEDVNVGALLRRMNERIEVLLGRDHCLGHAYFLPLLSNRTLPALSTVFRQQILPLLQEYFFEDWERIHWVLNDHRKAPQHRFLVRPADDLEALFGSDQMGRVQDNRWTVNDDAFASAASFAGVIGTQP